MGISNLGFGNPKWVAGSGGTPAPDGLVFNLVAKWHRSDEPHRAATAAATADGGFSFHLVLPGETAGRTVRLVISRAEASTYQADPRKGAPNGR